MLQDQSFDLVQSEQNLNADWRIDYESLRVYRTVGAGLSQTETIDDAVALCLALFDSRLEVVAVTATEGNVTAKQASRNVQAVIEHLDPPRFPRVGAASPVDGGPVVDARPMQGDDGLGNVGFVVSQLQHLP